MGRLTFSASTDRDVLAGLTFSASTDRGVLAGLAVTVRDRLVIAGGRRWRGMSVAGAAAGAERTSFRSGLFHFPVGLCRSDLQQQSLYFPCSISFFLPKTSRTELFYYCRVTELQSYP